MSSNSTHYFFMGYFSASRGTQPWIKLSTEAIKSGEGLRNMSLETEGHEQFHKVLHEY